MTAEQFATAALELQQRGIITSGHGWKADLARKAGWTRPTIDKFLTEGTKQIQTDLAVSALLAGLVPYP